MVVVCKYGLRRETRASRCFIGGEESCEITMADFKALGSSSKTALCFDTITHRNEYDRSISASSRLSLQRRSAKPRRGPNRGIVR